MKILVSALSVLVCVGVCAMGAFALASEDPSSRDPHAPVFGSDASTLDAPKVDLSAAAALPQTTREITIVASPVRTTKTPHKATSAEQTGKQWVCGPEREVNEGTTVRPCEWR